MKTRTRLALGILVGASAIGVSAFKTNDGNASKDVTQATYYWFATNNAGALTEFAIPNAAQSEASNRLGCHETSGNFCGRGYSAEQTEVNGSGQRVLKSTTLETSSLIDVRRD
ncbi:hypothetical protein SAMN05216436_1125 [bacterium A37T11]|nr:hypothetical protein SAMN05216436_1125 [bacterium A37T11]